LVVNVVQRDTLCVSHSVLQIFVRTQDTQLETRDNLGQIETLDHSSPAPHPVKLKDITNASRRKEIASGPAISLAFLHGFVGFLGERSEATQKEQIHLSPY